MLHKHSIQQIHTFIYIYTHTYSGQVISILCHNSDPFLLAPICVDLELDQGVQGYAVDRGKRERVS